MSELDMTARYSVEYMPGVAFYLRGYATTTQLAYGCDHDDDLYETVEDTSRVRAVMVGDDSEHVIDVDDLTPLDREDYCGECGQIGCGHDGYDRESEDE